MLTVQRWVPIVTMSAAIVALVVIGLWALYETTLLTALPCGVNEPSAVKRFEDAHPGDLRWKIGVPTLFALSFIAGRLLANVREATGHPPPGPPQGRGASWLQLLLPLLLTLVAALLFYEAWALAAPGRWPITYYIRCAAIVAPVQTLGAACIMCGLFGHWFWSPQRPSRLDD